MDILPFIITKIKTGFFWFHLS